MFKMTIEDRIPKTREVPLVILHQDFSGGFKSKTRGRTRSKKARFSLTCRCTCVISTWSSSSEVEATTGIGPSASVESQQHTVK